MKILEEREIQSRIDAHGQLYKNSCIPSAVEMVLKSLNRADKDYYELQKRWGKRTDRSFDIFIDCFTNEGECKGLIFRKREDLANDLFRVIDEELKADRYVIISAGDHMWIIYGKTDDDYLNFSKASCSSQMITFQCCFQYSLRNYVRNVMCKTDILTYTEGSQ